MTFNGRSWGISNLDVWGAAVRATPTALVTGLIGLVISPVLQRRRGPGSPGEGCSGKVIRQSTRCGRPGWVEEGVSSDGSSQSPNSRLFGIIKWG